MDIAKSLIQETLKMKDRLYEVLPRIHSENPEGDQFLENIKAYVKDSDYFIERDDPIRAFECVVWAWAWLEIGLEMKLLKEK